MTKDKALEIVKSEARFAERVGKTLLADALRIILKDYNDENTAWKLATELVANDRKGEYNAAFDGLTAHEVMQQYSAQEALEKYRAYKKSKNDKLDFYTDTGMDLSDIITKARMQYDGMSPV